MKQVIRIGNGFDVHKLVDGRALILGGVEIPYSKGLFGHSDADVLLHAIADAMLGALAQGDIGKHFPDSDMAFKDIDSKILLKEVYAMITKQDYFVGNLDTTIMMQRPKIALYIDKMREIIADILLIPVGDVSVKATTTEKLGFVGREEGVAALANVILYKR